MKDETVRMLINLLPLLSSAIALGIWQWLYSIENYYTEEYTMENWNWVPITVALIGVAGTLFSNFMHFKKDSHKISEVKTDTAVIKPAAERTERNVDVIREDVGRNVLPSLTVIKKYSEGLNDQVGQLVEELNFQKRLKSELNSNVVNKDYFTTGIDQLYETIVSLEHENDKLRLENERLHLKYQPYFEKERNKQQDRDFEQQL